MHKAQKNSLGSCAFCDFLRPNAGLARNGFSGIVQLVSPSPSSHPTMIKRLLAVVFFCGLFLAARAATPQKPNVLFIAIDDLRDWVGYFAHNPQAKTPNLDRVAKMGLSFSRAYCAAPVCNPSRAALMSGLRPFTTGVYDNGNDWRTRSEEHTSELQSRFGIS